MPMKAVVRKGDPTSGGGTVLGGSSTFTSEGAPVATLGDEATCQVPGHPRLVRIVEGSNRYVCLGRAVAYDGCRLSCGCTVLATSSVFLIEMEEEALALDSTREAIPTMDPTVSRGFQPGPARMEEKAALCAEEAGKHAVRGPGRTEAWYRSQGKEIVRAAKRGGVPAGHVSWVIAQARGETGNGHVVGKHNVFNLTGQGTEGVTTREVTEYDSKGKAVLKIQSFGNYANIQEAVDAYLKRIKRFWPDAYAVLIREGGHVGEFADGLLKGVGGRKYGTDPLYKEKLEEMVQQSERCLNKYGVD